MSLTGAQTAIDENKQVVTISLVDVRVALLPLSSVETGTRVFFFHFKYLVGNVGPKCLSTTPTRRVERL